MFARSSVPCMNTWNERVKARRLELDLTLAELARLIGIQGPSLIQWESGRTKTLKGQNLMRAAKALKVRPEWLLTGKGPLEPSAPLRPIVAWDSPEDLGDGFGYLPKLDYYLSAGPGGFDPDMVEATDKVTPFRSDFMKAHGWDSGTHFTMRCKGESMEPTIQDGGPVVIDTSSKSIRSGKVYAILIDGDPLLKRLDKLPGGIIRVRSDNQAQDYAPFEVSEGAVEVIGRAVWTAVLL